MDNKTIHLITTAGLQLLIGQDGDDVRDKITQKDSILDYQFYDEDNKAWELWAVQDSGGEIKPLKFLDPDHYGMTSADLYSKSVTYAQVLAQAIEIITRKTQSLWDKMMKPATIIGAIVLIILIMAIGIVALQG